ncbi:MAG: Fe-S cluster assembly scaffold protein NifU [Candidatus Thermoplasmatota archaeon]
MKITDKKVYMDYAASTPVDPKIIKEIRFFFDKYYGNPSSTHQYGKIVRKHVQNARKKISDLINCSPEEIIFTSGGTESDNLAIKGIAYQHKDIRKEKGTHIITSNIEHPAVLKTCRHLEKIGFNVEYLPVNEYGLIDVEEFKDKISKNTFLTTVMYANNEIGTIQPIKEIGEINKENDVLFHTDAVQAIGKKEIDVKKEKIDLLSISSHKIYGPKGAGALYLKKDVKISPLFHGGGHEKNIRSGTLNTPGIIGLGKACELAKNRMKKDVKYMRKLRDKLIKNILQIEETYLNGHPEKRLVNNTNFRFSAVEGESIHMMLDKKGIASATGSACSSKKLKPSHVLTAIGLTPEQAHGSIRLSIGRNSTQQEIEYVSKILPKAIERLRQFHRYGTKKKLRYNNHCFIGFELIKMEDMYNEKVKEHFFNPRNVGEIKDADGIGKVGNPSCGDVMAIYIKVEDDRIKDIKFKTFGCAAAIASSSIATEIAKDMTLEEAKKLSREDVAGELGGLPDLKMHCSNLATDALKKAIEDYEKKKK